MQIILIISNIVLGLTVLTLVFGPRLVRILKQRKLKRETKRNDKIRKIVEEYLNELRNDN